MAQKATNNSFAVQISRELGGITARMDSMSAQHKEMREDQKNYFEILCKDIKEIKEQGESNAKEIASNSKEIAIVKTKSGIISTVVSSAIALGGLILNTKH